MNELIKIQTNEQGQQLVSGRELHKVLEIGTQFTKWIQRMIDYGFTKDVDYTLVIQKRLTNNPKNPYTEETDYILTLEMAKHIAMLQRSEIGMTVRKYFIECEKKLKEQSNTLMLSPLQKYGLILLDNNSSDMEKLQALSEFRELSNNEGKVLVCDDGTITIPQIRDYVMKHYGDILFENDVLISESFIEWTRFLRNIGYIKYVTFNKKGKEHKEAKPTPQPTDLFKDTFVKQGMAMVRSTNDERNKEIITYTKDIEKFIVSDYFKENFFKYFNVA